MSRQKNLLILGCMAACLCAFSGKAADDTSIIGYRPDAVSAERMLEKNIQAAIDPAQAKEYLRHLSDEPNMAGTPGDHRHAEYVREQLAALGFDAKIYPYYVYLPYPQKTEVTINSPEKIVIHPGEKGVAADPDSLKPEEYPPFNAFSPSGIASGEAVYVNYGTADDYAELEKLGVDVRGKVLICRYGRLFRGSKAWEAEKRGAAALILYSDPADDGYFRGDVYPKGPMRPGDGIQRGSIYYMFSTPGDPLTPNEPALKDAKRIEPAQAGLPKIVTTPIGYDDAAKILSRLDGADVPQAWQGALPFRYHIGPGPARLTVTVEVEYKVREIWDVVATLRGTVAPDEWVIVGAHRDSWVFGAQDPNSGGAVMLTAARAISEAARANGGLRRSIVICSWDAEEFGVIGSVEWVEQMRDQLAAKAVVYMNADAVISGRSFNAASTPTLRPAFKQVLSEVTGPDKVSLYQQWQEQRARSGQKDTQVSFGSFGGGSDHIGFLLHVGIPCVSEGFGGPSGIYHSVYDTFHWMETFGDPGFASHAAAARAMAVLLARLANADVIPYAPSEYAGDLRDMITKLKDEGGARAESLSELSPVIDMIEELGRDYEDRVARALADGILNGERLQKLNAILLSLERSFIDPDGVPGRPWNRSLIYATALNNGYGQDPLPSLHAALDDEAEFKVQLARVRAVLEKYRNGVSEALQVVLN